MLPATLAALPYPPLDQGPLDAACSCGREEHNPIDTLRM